MSRRVYEVAREQGLSTKEVMGRLKEAGAGAKSNLSVVDDPAYQRVFGGGPNGRSGTGEAKVAPRGVGRARRRALLLSRHGPRRRSRVLRARGVGRAPRRSPTPTPTVAPLSAPTVTPTSAPPTSTRGWSPRRSRVLGALARVLVGVLVFAVAVGLGAAAALVF